MMKRLRRRLRRGVAYSWHASRLWYGLNGLRIDGPSEDEIWYFAYGANMHDSAFRGRRRMRSKEWRAGRILGYRLRFNLDGRPIGMAAPANISADAQSEVWGVLYELTRRNLVRLDATEDVPGPRYRHLWTDAEDIDGRALKVVTYIAEGKEKDGNPSLRYIKLLREGARAHGLPQHWVSFLESVRPARASDSLCPQSDLRALSAGVEDPKAIGFRRISINDLDWRPSPLPNADAWRAGELDLPAGAFNCNARPGFGSARLVHAVRTQHIGEDSDRVVALESDEGGRFG